LLLIEVSTICCVFDVFLSEHFVAERVIQGFALKKPRSPPLFHKLFINQKQEKVQHEISNGEFMPLPVA
jgi:hypothetical protein